MSRELRKLEVLVIALVIISTIEACYIHALFNEINKPIEVSTIKGTVGVNNTIRLNLFETYEIEQCILNWLGEGYMGLTLMGFTYGDKPILGLKLNRDNVYYIILNTNPYPLRIFGGGGVSTYELNITAYGIDRYNFIEIERFNRDDYKID